ncbi:MAG: Tad domain-containing protein [Candidatus Thiodiazotropha sp.]
MNSHTNHQSGQALPMGIAFLMSTLLLMLVLFNTGQSASERSRLLNTADAAVYSGLIWQARALNFQAYSNRAMAANQVSIGQLVSLTSWSQYAYITARNIDEVALYFPVIKTYTELAQTVTENIDDVMVTIAETFIPIIDSVNSLLSRMQQAVYVASFEATPAIVREVVQHNDVRYQVDTAYAVIGLGENVVGWDSFSHRYDDREDLLRKVDLVNRSKDEFTADRDLGTSQLIPGAPSVLSIPGVLRVWVSKEGATNLIVEEDSSDGNETVESAELIEFEWKGKDTLSLHVERRKMTKSGLRWVHTEYPIGWGARHLNGDFECEENEEGYEVCPRYMQENRVAEWFADMYQDELNATYNGVRAYYDLSNLNGENQDPRLALRIEVELPQRQIRTASKIDGLGSESMPVDELRNGIGDGMFGTEDQMAGAGMAVIASGELYFHPPDDYNPAMREGRYEIASLFSPYWEVHLIDTPMERVFMAWSLRDEALLTQGVSGVADGVEYYAAEKEEELEQLNQLQNMLQSQLESTLDEASRTQIETQLTSVEAQIAELESMEFSTEHITGSLQQQMVQGVESAANTELADYEHSLQEYGSQQGMDLLAEFEEERVNEITEQLEQTLRRAEQTVGEAMSSLNNMQ